MKEKTYRFRLIISAIFLLFFLISCNNKKIELTTGTLVDTVSFNIVSQEGIIDVNEQNTIVTKIPKTVQKISRVPSVAPYRKGFEFSQYYDSQNTYKVGDVFTDSTQKDASGKVSLTLNFEPTKSNYYEVKNMFTLTGDEVKSTSLKTHGGSDPSSEIDVDFVTFPAGYSWVVPQMPGVKDSYQVGGDKYYDVIVGLNKGTNDNEVTSWVVEDFALMTTEVPSALFKVILDWNDEENKGYEFGFDRHLSSSLSLKDTSFPYYGSNYDILIDKYCNRNSAYDPVCFVPYDSAIVFCNALTEWYNEKYGASLTPAYTIDGSKFGAVIKSVYMHSDYIKYIDTLSSDSEIDNNKKTLLPDNATFIPHVQGATGFRLPTSAEWMFAATIDYNNNVYNSIDNAHVEWFIYPNMIKPNNVSGARNANYSDESVYRRIVSSDNYGKTSSHRGGNGTQIVQGGKLLYYSQDAYISELPNLGGIYDMSGNVAEWTEDLALGSDASTLSRAVWGGSFMSSASNSVPSNYKCVKTIFKNKSLYGNESEYLMDVGVEDGVAENDDNNNSIGFVGLRLCRTVDSIPINNL